MLHKCGQDVPEELQREVVPVIHVIGLLVLSSTVDSTINGSTGLTAEPFILVAEMVAVAALVGLPMHFRGHFGGRQLEPYDAFEAEEDEQDFAP